MKITNNDMAIHLEQWSISGLSKKSYCKKHAIAYHRFQYYWRRYSIPDDSEKGFTLLKVSNDKQAGKIELHLPNGCYFSVPEDCSVSLLQKLVSLC